MDDVVSGYGASEVLHGISLTVNEGETVCLLGSNAAGKSTTLRTILGMVPTRKGSVTLRGERIDGLPTTEIVAKGITMVPENRRLFAKMTVRENLEIGAQLRDDRPGIESDIDRVFSMFPRLRERVTQKAGTLSGGEQQMLAIGRALMAKPSVLLMDEPSMGLAPILVEQVFETIDQISKDGITILVVEQNANVALGIADRGYVIQTGRIVMKDSAEALLANPELSKAYLGELEG
ncbi:MAG: ABC transporter ATP-binding protein [Acidimicrobiia bacterium]